MFLVIDATPVLSNGTVAIVRFDHRKLTLPDGGVDPGPVTVAVKVTFCP